MNKINHIINTKKIDLSPTANPSLIRSASIFIVKIKKNKAGFTLTL